MIYAFSYCNVDIHHEVIYQEVNFVWIFDEGRNINTISRQWQSDDLKVKRNRMGRGGMWSLMCSWLGMRRPTREVCLCLFNPRVVYWPAQIIEVFTALVCPTDSYSKTKSLRKNNYRVNCFTVLISYYYFGIATLFDVNRTESWYSWNTCSSRIFWLKSLQRLERKPPPPNRK